MTDELNISTDVIKPTLIAQKCPVCNGWGTVSFKKIPCHACENKGFVLIPTETDRQNGKTT